MIPELDIYRAAKLVIDRDGEDAQLYAAARMVVLAGEGDEEGAAIWRQIAAAVEELQRVRRSDAAVIWADPASPQISCAYLLGSGWGASTINGRLAREGTRPVHWASRGGYWSVGSR